MVQFFFTFSLPKYNHALSTLTHADGLVAEPGPAKTISGSSILPVGIKKEH